MGSATGNGSMLNYTSVSEELFALNEVYKLELKEIRSLYQQYVNPAVEDILYTFSFGEDVVDTAEGVWMKFRNKEEKVFDATGGTGVLNLGHNHPDILKARIAFQQQQKVEVHKMIFSPYTAALSHNFSKLFNEELQYSFFCNSGAEAVEGALKAAYKYHDGKRKCVLHSATAYHGKLLGAGSITGSSEVNFKFPAISGAHSFTYNNLDSVKRHLHNLKTNNGGCDIYALIIEPFSVSTFTAATVEFLKELRSICDEHDIVLIFDEVFTGWFKTGELFNFFRTGIYPDILVTSKAMGGGKASISALIANKKVYLKAYGSTQFAYLHSTTYNGFGEECVTAIEAINVLFKENVYERTKVIEQKVNNAFTNMKNKYSQFVAYNGVGSLFGYQISVVPKALGALLEVLPSDYVREDLFIKKLEAAAFSDYIFREHNMFTLFGGQKEIVVLFAPAAIVSEADLDAALQTVEAAVSKFSFTHVIDFAWRKFKKKLV